MSYHVDGLTFERIILVTLMGDIIDEEMKIADQAIFDLMDLSLESHIHVIMDHTDAGKLPKMQAFSELNWTQHPKMGHLIAFGTKTVEHRFSLRFIAQFFSIPVQTLYNLEQSLDYLRQVDTSLDAVEVSTQP